MKACGSTAAIGLQPAIPGFVSSTSRVPSRSSALAEFRPDVVHAQIVHTHLSYASLTAEEAGPGSSSTRTRDDLLPNLTCFHGGESAAGRSATTAPLAEVHPLQRLRWNPWQRGDPARARRDAPFVRGSDELARVSGERIQSTGRSTRHRGASSMPSAERSRTSGGVFDSRESRCSTIAGAHEQKVRQLLRVSPPRTGSPICACSRWAAPNLGRPSSAPGRGLGGRDRS